MFRPRQVVRRLIHRKSYLAAFALEDAGNRSSVGRLPDGRRRKPWRCGPSRESISRQYRRGARRALCRRRIDHPLRTRSESLPDDLRVNRTHRRKHHHLADSVTLTSDFRLPISSFLLLTSSFTRQPSRAETLQEWMSECWSRLALGPRYSGY